LIEWAGRHLALNPLRSAAGVTRGKSWLGCKVYRNEIDERAKTTEAVGAAQEWKPATGVPGLRAEGRQPGTSNECKSRRGGVDAGDGYGPPGND
jgi:hypothetical protein